MSKKNIVYKIFDTAQTVWDDAIWDMDKWNTGLGILLDTWSREVISEIAFGENINSGASELVVRLARTFIDFGEGVDIEFKNKVEVWVTDIDNSTGIRLFTGYISRYSPVYLSTQSQYVDVTVLPYSVELANYILEDSNGNTTVTYSSQDPSAILKDVIDKYRALSGTINYKAGSVDDTGTTVSYIFKNTTIRDALEKIVNLAPDNWYFYFGTDHYIFF